MSFMMASSLRWARIGILGGVLLVVTGCGGGLNTAQVDGTVTLDGKPLDQILVEFLPTGEGPRSFGETDAQGKFTLMTDDGKTPGAAIGNHKVTLKDGSVITKFMGRQGEGVDMSEGRKPRISGKLASPDTSPLSATVTADGANTLTFEAAIPN